MKFVVMLGNEADPTKWAPRPEWISPKSLDLSKAKAEKGWPKTLGSQPSRTVDLTMSGLDKCSAKLSSTKILWALWHNSCSSRAKSPLRKTHSGKSESNSTNGCSAWLFILEVFSLGISLVKIILFHSFPVGVSGS